MGKQTTTVVDIFEALSKDEWQKHLKFIGVQNEFIAAFLSLFEQGREAMMALLNSLAKPGENVISQFDAYHLENFGFTVKKHSGAMCSVVQLKVEDGRDCFVPTRVVAQASVVRTFCYAMQVAAKKLDAELA